jgi:hypothetical protein
MNQIEIPLSKSKLFLGIGGSILFVILGFFLITVIAGEQTPFNPMLIKGVGILSVVFFTITGIYSVRKISDKKIGLTLDETGITDNSSGVSVGFISDDKKNYSGLF